LTIGFDLGCVCVVKTIKSGDGRVYIWDVRQRKCRHVFVDDGCIHSSSLAVSPNGRYVACG
jgi:hypothetical protein